MFCRNFLLLIIFIFLSNCKATTLINKKPSETYSNPYSNRGFALVYNDDLFKEKIINKKIDKRSLIIFQKSLKVNTPVKITNILNNKSLIATVGSHSKYPTFYNAVMSKRIAEELDLDLSQPYVEILEILENSFFIAKKAKTYKEEKSVAVKAPVKDITINDLNVLRKNDEKNYNIKFFYTIKIADFYFNDTALMMLKRIKTESLIKNPKIEKITKNKYRVYLGPFNNINSLQKSYNDISILQFENIEIIKND